MPAPASVALVHATNAASQRVPWPATVQATPEPGLVSEILMGSSPPVGMVAALPWYVLVDGSANGAAKGSAGVAGQDPVEYTVRSCGAIWRSKREAMAASMVGRISAPVSASTWSLNESAGPLLTKIASAGEVAFSHSR